MTSIPVRVRGLGNRHGLDFGHPVGKNRRNEAEEFEPPPFQSNQERGGNVLGRIAGLNLPERFHVIYVNIFLD